MRLYGFLVLILSFPVVTQSFAQTAAPNGVSKSNAQKVCEAVKLSHISSLDVATVVKNATEKFISSLPPEQRAKITNKSDFYNDFNLAEKKLTMAEGSHGFESINLPFMEKKYPDVFSAYAKALSLDAGLESEIYSQANLGTSNDYSISVDSIEKRASELVKLVADQVQKDQTLTQASKNVIVPVLLGTKIVTAHSASNESNWSDKIESSMLVSALCGDFTTIGAFAIMAPSYSDTLLKVTKVEDGIQYATTIGYKSGSVPQAEFVVCPGLVATVANLKNKRLGIDFVLAHEISHIITAAMMNSNQNAGRAMAQSLAPSSLNSSILKDEKGVLSCLQTNYGTHFQSISNLVERFQKESDQIPDLATRLSSTAHAELERYQGLLAQYTQFYGSSPDSVTSHASEILADYWATRVLAPEIAKIADVPAYELIGSYMKAYIRV